MANKGLHFIAISDNANPPFVGGDVVRVFFDPVTDLFTVTRNGVEILSGPTLSDPTEFVVPPFGAPSFVTHYTVFRMDDSGNPIVIPGAQFSYCALSVLISFDSSKTFPYSTKTFDINSPSCSGVVCDLAFIGTPEISQPPDTTTATGEIIATAFSSHLPIRYSLTDVPYAEMTNTTGHFTGLMAGQITIYAEDFMGCEATLVVDLKASFNYGVKYRLEYDDINSWISRVDVLQLDYIGEITNVFAGKSPMTIKLRGENGNFFDPVLATEAIIEFLSDTDLKYLMLFTQSDREYLVIFYKNIGSGLTEYWRGWVTPGLYTEPYDQPRNYIVSINATDYIAKLSEESFREDSGELVIGRFSIIQIIAKILLKTGLELPIKVALNIFETGMHHNGSSIESLVPPIFDTSPPAWKNVGPGTPWIVDGNEIYVTLTTGQSQEWTYEINQLNTQPGAYNYFINRTASGLGVGDSLNLHYNFYDEFGTLLAHPTTTEFITFDFTLNYPFGGTTPTAVKKIGIVAQVNSGSGMTLRIHGFPLTGPVEAVDKDPLNQVFIDADKAYVTDGNPLSCNEVLSNILSSFGARLIQWAGYWNIVRMDEMSDVYAYRTFDKTGSFYMGSGTFGPVINLLPPEDTNRVCWRDRTQNLEVIGGIGKSSITFSLRKVPFGIKNGGFEDVILPNPLPGTIGGWPGWTLILNGNSGGYPYIIPGTLNNLNGNDSKYSALITSASDNPNYAEDIYLQSADQQIIFSANDAARFFFDYKGFSLGSDVLSPFVKFKFSITIGNQYYLTSDGTWISFDTLDSVAALKSFPTTGVRTGQYKITKYFESGFYQIRLYKLYKSTAAENLPSLIRPNDYDFTTNDVVWVMVDSVSSAFDSVPPSFTNRYSWVEIFVNSSDYNSWNTVDITTLLPPVASQQISFFNIKLMTGSIDRLTWLIGGELNLRQVTTRDKQEGYIIWTKSTPPPGIYTYTYRFYKLTAGISDDSPPNVIRPNDFDVDNNAMIWSLDQEVTTGISNTPGYYGMALTSIRNFDNAGVEFLPAGEVPPETKVFEVLNDKNYKETGEITLLNGDAPIDVVNAANIYENYYRLLSGAPTQVWTRDGEPEQQPLLALLAKQYVEQFKRPKLKLTGSFKTDVFFGFTSSFFDGDRYFIPMGLTLKDKECSYDAEILELEPVGNLSPFGPGEFVRTEFGLEYDI